jgi:hypothetical protein
MMLEATADIAQTSMQALTAMFQGRLIYHFASITWPGHSTNLAIPEYFLCGFIKSMVHKMCPANIDD